MNCKEAKERHEAALLRIPGVHGVGVGEHQGKACIRVFCDHPPGDDNPEHHNPPIQSLLEGHPVKVTGTNPPFAFILGRRLHHVEGGFSIGHYAITAGTVGIPCEDQVAAGKLASFFPFPPPFTPVAQPNPIYILSNNHVLANSNDAQIGDPILQPGPIDGGTIANDTLGRLARYIPIQFAPAIPIEQHNNLVDAALAQVPFEDVEKKIRGIGYLRYWRPTANIRVGDIVQKTGRTTQHTLGRITAINATIDVGYGGGKTARFKNQIITTGMAAGGDSGSLIVSLDNIVVGLLFAGSTDITVFNPIEAVQDALKIAVAYLVEGQSSNGPSPPMPPPPGNGTQPPPPPPGDIPQHRHPIDGVTGDPVPQQPSQPGYRQPTTQPSGDPILPQK